MHLRRTGIMISFVALMALVMSLWGGMAGAEKVPDAAHGGRPLSTALSGANEVPPAVDPDSTGSAVITLNRGLGEVCWEITTAGVEPVVAAHIHRAPVGVNGPVVVPLTAVQNGTASGCASVPRTLIDEIMADPTGFYVNVHTTVFPGGALRGQLG